MSRRQQILDTAAELFAARGFHGVSVADLGAACGISGPALYKHFPAKESILAEMLVSISEELLRVGRERVAAAPDGRSAVAALVDWHVDFALRHKPLIVVQDRDWESLPPTPVSASASSSAATSTCGPTSSGAPTPTGRAAGTAPPRLGRARPPSRRAPWPTSPSA